MQFVTFTTEIHLSSDPSINDRTGRKDWQKWILCDELALKKEGRDKPATCDYSF